MGDHDEVVARLPKLHAVYAAEVLVVIGAIVAAIVSSLRRGELANDTVVGTVVAVLVVVLLGRVVHEARLTPGGTIIARAPLRRRRHLEVDELIAVRWVHARMAVLLEHPGGSLALSWRLVGLEVLLAEVARRRPDLRVELPSFARRTLLRRR